MNSSATCQPISLHHSLASAASIRMSLRPSSAMCADISRTASRANAVAAMKAIFASTAACSPIGWPPCTRSRLHCRDIFKRVLRGRGAHRRERQPSGVQRAQGHLEAVADATDDVLRRDQYLVEAGDAVLDAAQAHERVAVLDGDAGSVGLDDEGGDAAALPFGRGDSRHHHQQLRDDAVRRPELDPVELVGLPAVHGDGGHRQPRRVGADVGLGEQERADRPPGAAGQVALLLFLGAGQLQRFGDADGLVGD